MISTSVHPCPSPLASSTIINGGPCPPVSSSAASGTTSNGGGGGCGVGGLTSSSSSNSSVSSSVSSVTASNSPFTFNPHRSHPNFNPTKPVVNVPRPDVVSAKPKVKEGKSSKNRKKQLKEDRHGSGGYGGGSGGQYGDYPYHQYGYYPEDEANAVAALEDETGVNSQKSLAASRYHRNNLLISEVFSDKVMPDLRSVVTNSRLEVLRRQADSLIQHQERSLSELATMEKCFTEKKRKILESREDFHKQLEEMAKKPVVDENTYQRMLEVAMEQIKDQQVKREEEKEEAPKVTEQSKAAETNGFISESEPALVAQVNGQDKEWNKPSLANEKTALNEPSSRITNGDTNLSLEPNHLHLQASSMAVHSNMPSQSNGPLQPSVSSVSSGGVNHTPIGDFTSPLEPVGVSSSATPVSPYPTMSATATSNLKMSSHYAPPHYTNSQQSSRLMDPSQSYNSAPISSSGYHHHHPAPSGANHYSGSLESYHGHQAMYGAHPAGSYPPNGSHQPPPPPQPHPPSSHASHHPHHQQGSIPSTGEYHHTAYASKPMAPGSSYPNSTHHHPQHHIHHPSQGPTPHPTTQHQSHSHPHGPHSQPQLDFNMRNSNQHLSSAAPGSHHTPPHHGSHYPGYGPPHTAGGGANSIDPMHHSESMGSMAYRGRAPMAPGYGPPYGTPLSGGISHGPQPQHSLGPPANARDAPPNSTPNMLHHNSTLHSHCPPNASPFAPTEIPNIDNMKANNAKNTNRNGQKGKKSNKANSCNKIKTETKSGNRKNSSKSNDKNKSVNDEEEDEDKSDQTELDTDNDNTVLSPLNRKSGPSAIDDDDDRTLESANEADDKSSTEDLKRSENNPKKKGKLSTNSKSAKYSKNQSKANSTKNKKPSKEVVEEVVDEFEDEVEEDEDAYDIDDDYEEEDDEEEEMEEDEDEEDDEEDDYDEDEEEEDSKARLRGRKRSCTQSIGNSLKKRSCNTPAGSTRTLRNRKG